MPFTKGNKHGNGRPKGSKNIETIEKRNLIGYIKEQGVEKFLQELETLEGKEYCKIYKDIVELAFPKLSRTELSGDLEEKHKPILVKFLNEND